MSTYPQLPSDPEKPALGDTMMLDQTSYVPPPASSVVNQQPGYVTSTTTVITQQQPQPKRLWQSGICDCFHDMRSCCGMFWLGPCYLGSMAQRMGENCCVGCFLSGLWPMRSAFRERHGIQGNLCEDFCTIYFCGSCVACQLAREMNHVGYPKNCC